MSTQVRDSPEELRYEIRVDEQLAGFAQYRLKDDRITIFHAEIDPDYRGRGLGDELAHDTLEDVRRRGLVLVPRCPFIASYVHRHPDEYLDLVAPGLRATVMEGDDDES
ncbi:MAG TPA: GNAT family N-acetyltransferase [Solirubrobacteraceae bacterium]|nr:GNAT family N-acetyltransferase [Solirubrobacteraceae bacterium]